MSEQEKIINIEALYKERAKLRGKIIKALREFTDATGLAANGDFHGAPTFEAENFAPTGYVYNVTLHIEV